MVYHFSINNNKKNKNEYENDNFQLNSHIINEISQVETIITNDEEHCNIANSNLVQSQIVNANLLENTEVIQQHEKDSKDIEYVDEGNLFILDVCVLKNYS